MNVGGSPSIVDAGSGSESRPPIYPPLRTTSYPSATPPLPLAHPNPRNGSDDLVSASHARRLARCGAHGVAPSRAPLRDDGKRPPRDLFPPRARDGAALAPAPPRLRRVSRRGVRELRPPRAPPDARTPVSAPRELARRVLPGRNAPLASVGTGQIVRIRPLGAVAAVRTRRRWAPPVA